MFAAIPHRTKIIATIGPATRSESAIAALLEAGADAVRLNFSHGSHEDHAAVARSVRRLASRTGRPVAIIQDLQGPKIRVGEIAAGSMLVVEGDEVLVTTGRAPRDGRTVPIERPSLAQDLGAGNRILLGDGEVELEILSAVGDAFRARVTVGGTVKPHQGVHLPGVEIRETAPTEKDIEDLKSGLQLGVDYVAMSFVKSRDDIDRLKNAMREAGREVPIIAKLEKREAIGRLDEIMAAVEGVMVARGDLGLELPLEEVPLLQKEIINRANEQRILVITATQMLESMITSPRPTRAEASDVANAILDGTDAIMLSAETAAGRYPTEAVRVMTRIAFEIEGAHATPSRNQPRRFTDVHAMSHAAAVLSGDIGAAAIVVFTQSGYSAQLVSKERPAIPIFALTPSEDVFNRLALWWNVTPVLLDLGSTAEETLAAADAHLVARGRLLPGDKAVVARWSSGSETGWTNFIIIRELGAGH